MAAQNPDPPANPPELTQEPGSTLIEIKWEPAVDQGSPLTAYYVYVKESSGSYSLPLGECDPSRAELLTTRLCTVSVDVLTADPYLITYGSPVIAHVVAENVFGVSVPSADGTLD